jgi:hypothetical protein
MALSTSANGQTGAHESLYGSDDKSDNRLSERRRPTSVRLTDPARRSNRENAVYCVADTCAAILAVDVSVCSWLTSAAPKTTSFWLLAERAFQPFSPYFSLVRSRCLCPSASHQPRSSSLASFSPRRRPFSFSTSIFLHLLDHVAGEKHGRPHFTGVVAESQSVYSGREWTTARNWLPSQTPKRQSCESCRLSRTKVSATCTPRSLTQSALSSLM